MAERLAGEGLQLYQAGTKESLEAALQKLAAALPLFHSLNDRRGEATMLTGIGSAYADLGEQQKALDYYAQALPIFRAVGERNGEALALNNIGSVYDDLGEKPRALDYYAQALPIRRAVGDRRGEAATLSNIGKVYSALGEKQKALEYLSQSLPIYREVEDRNGEAGTLNNIGGVYADLGEQQKALDYYAQALPLRRAVGDRSGEAVTLSNIGLVYSALGEQQKALDYYAQALPLRRAVGDRGGEAYTLNNIGGFYSDLGEKQKALDYFSQALPLSREVGDRSGEATALNNIGGVYDDLGEKQKALDYYAQALPLRRAVRDRSGEAVTLSNIGKVYSALGEKQKALDYYAQALPIRREVGDRRGEAATLNNIGSVYKDLGEKPRALDYYAQALPIRRAVGDRRGEATTLSNIGSVYDDLGEKQKALDYYEQALPLSRAVGDRRGEAYTLSNIGGVYNDLGEKQKALDYVSQALLLIRAVGDRNGEATTLSNIALVERDRGNLTQALPRIESALAIIESLRTNITNQELRASYFATVQDYYQFYIDLLMRLHKLRPSEGNDAKALQASERARARALLETLAEANADIRQGVDPQLVERERLLQQQLNLRAQAQIKLFSASHTEEQAAIVAKEIETLTNQLQQIETEIRQKSPRYAALTQPQPLSLPEIQKQVLDADTLLLEYSLGDEQSYLWAVTPDSITSYELPKRAEIEDAARKFRDLLTVGGAWPGSSNGTAAQRGGTTPVQSSASLAPEAATRLARLLLSPVASQLGKKRLLIVSDGALQYVPFSALPNPTTAAQTVTYQPMVVEHEIVSLPSASTLALLRRDVGGRKPSPKAVAVLADPVFSRDDARLTASISKTTRPTTVKSSASSAALNETNRLDLTGRALSRSAKEAGVTRAGGDLPRLRGTRREAEQILSVVGKDNARLMLDFDANRATATSPDLSQYRFVHFATHGLMDSLHPELSGIALSMIDEKGNPQDGFLRLHDVFNLKLPAELVVLSACQTGLGKEVKGEGLVGLTRGFMYAGAPRVVVSLWSVSDEGTAELMTRFYSGMLKDKLRPAAALRAAQVSMLGDQRFASPFFWAAFTLQGEWQ
jgi:CHAT domain-containing protein/Tfp pilus assembly protein PilF